MSKHFEYPKLFLPSSIIFDGGSLGFQTKLNLYLSAPFFDLYKLIFFVSSKKRAIIGLGFLSLSMATMNIVSLILYARCLFTSCTISSSYFHHEGLGLFLSCCSYVCINRSLKFIHCVLKTQVFIAQVCGNRLLDFDFVLQL